MDLLDRYLAAVAALLPKSQRDDIVAELRDTLLSQMEDKEAELGRPLTAKEREAVLRAFGHPIAVAGRYGAARSLIGPKLYPFYMFAVKGLLIVAAVVTAIPLVISVIIGGQQAAGALGHFISGFITLAMTLIGAATIVGYGIERGWIPLGDSLDWKVADLPRLDRKSGKAKSRFEAAFELAAVLLFVLWWTGVLVAPWPAIVGSHGMFLVAAPIWTTLHWPILAFAGVQALAALATLVQPDRVRLRAVLDIVGDLGGLWIVAILWRAGRLAEVAGAVTDAAGSKAAEIAGLQASLDLSFHITVAVMAVIFAGKLAASVWRLARGGPTLVAAVA